MDDRLYEWAKRWGVPPMAVSELPAVLAPDVELSEGRSEGAVQTRIRLEASRKGMRLFRNNVGATYAEDGSFIRYGLANDSEKLNKVLKSSDLIGIRPVAVTEAHVGRTIGQFVAREVKAEGWKYSGTAREEAQLAFLAMIASMGGDARFADREGTL